MTLFWQKTSLKIEKDSKFSQNIWYFDKIESFWKLMIRFSYFYQKKNCFPFWAWPIMTTFFCELGPIKQFLHFINFFRTTWLQHKLLILIESPNIFHWHSTKKCKVNVVFASKFGTNLVQFCEKTKTLVFQEVVLIFCMRYTLTSMK